MTIETRVRAVLAAELGKPEEVIASEALLAEDLGADSLDSWSLVQALEIEFGIEIPEVDMPALQTVRQLVVYVEEKRVAYGFGV